MSLCSNSCCMYAMGHLRMGFNQYEWIELLHIQTIGKPMQNCLANQNVT